VLFRSISSLRRSLIYARDIELLAEDDP